MRDAPCSVEFFGDRSLGLSFKVDLRVIIIFIGGPNDREALALVWRMSKHRGIQISVVKVHLLGEAVKVDSTPQAESKGQLSAVLDCEKQRELDDEYVSSFRLTTVNNEYPISYSKKVHASDGIPQVLNELDKIGYKF